MVSLPFGRTDATADEIRGTIDTAMAVEQAQHGGVDNQEERIEAFIECIPRLLDWLEECGRLYPWRQTADPWKVYIAEILLQRTRADIVEGIYDTVLERFPNPETLYRASEEEIFETVESLGFGNHRTRTLQEVAELCYYDHGGTVPNSVKELQRPWRVGAYSARACCLFAFEQPLALVDTNTSRVIERVLGYEMPEQPHKSTAVYQLLDALTPSDPALARAFNLALLDIGALICTPSTPDCDICPLASGCASAGSFESA